MQSVTPGNSTAQTKWVAIGKPALVVLCAAGMIVAVAFLEGKRTNRWGSNEGLTLASKKLEKIPSSFGAWVGSENPIDGKILRVAEATGTISRLYHNTKTGDTINVLLLCGPSGPIGAHTPEVCYGGLGYSCRGTPTRKGLTFANGAASFWSAKFEKTTPTDEPLRVCWAWSTNGDWEASSNPRAAYALQPALYKLYLVQNDNPAYQSREPNQEPIEQFMTEFLPLVKSALADGPG
jgi:hypothetical protein